MTEHKSLAAALAAFQAACPTLPKDATNPHFKSKFTPLDTMVEVTGPLLAEHGLSWSAFPCFAQDGSPALRYVLRHVSGETESEVMPLLVVKADPQGMGAAITYARRYALAAVLNLVADEDDDGNHASQRQANGGQRAAAPRTTAQPGERSEAAATAPQRGAINGRLNQAGVSGEEAKAILQWKCGTSVLDRVPKRSASGLIEELGEDGSRAAEILQELDAAAQDGDPRASAIMTRYFQTEAAR